MVKSSVIFKLASGRKEPAVQHQNPDGTIGGWVAKSAKVDPTAVIEPDAIVEPGAVVGPETRVANGSIVVGKL